MSFGLIEEAIDTIKDYLETNMPVRLDTLDAEYGDFELEDIIQWYIAELTAIPAYPSVLLLGDYTEITGEGEGWLRGEHVITIVCLITDQETERLRRRLYRYIRAMVELLKEGRADFGYAIVFERIEFSPLYGRGSDFLGDSRLVVKLGKYES